MGQQQCKLDDALAQVDAKARWHEGLVVKAPGWPPLMVYNIEPGADAPPTIDAHGVRYYFYIYRGTNIDATGAGPWLITLRPMTPGKIGGRSTA